MSLDTSKFTYIENGKTLAVSAEKCTGCGLCLEVCPHSVLALKNRKIVIAARDRCMECGACSRNCPFGALDVKSGVGCVSAVITGLLRGTEPDCGCSGGKNTCC